MTVIVPDVLLSFRTMSPVTISLPPDITSVPVPLLSAVVDELPSFNPEIVCVPELWVAVLVLRMIATSSGPGSAPRLHLATVFQSPFPVEKMLLAAVADVAETETTANAIASTNSLLIEVERVIGLLPFS